VWKVNERAVSFYERLRFATTEEMADPDTGLAKLSCGGQSEAGRLERR